MMLVVAAIEGTAVHVGGGGIPAGVAVLQGLRDRCGPPPGQGLRSSSGPACWSWGSPLPAPMPVKPPILGGAVGILALGLADALEFGQAAVGVDAEVFHLVHSQLIQQGIPLGVVEVRAELETEVGGLAVVLDLQAVL